MKFKSQITFKYITAVLVDVLLKEGRHSLSVCLLQYRISIYKLGWVNFAKCQVFYERFSLCPTLPSSKQYSCIHLSPARLLTWD